jgi:hypothetical protein
LIIYRLKDIREIELLNFFVIGNSIIIGKGVSFKLVPLIIRLASLVITTSCSPWFSNSKVGNDATPFAFVLASNATYTNVGGMYLKSNMVNL